MCDKQLLGIVDGMGQEDSIWVFSYSDSRRYSSWNVYKDQYGNEVQWDYSEDEDNDWSTY